MVFKKIIFMIIFISLAFSIPIKGSTKVDEILNKMTTKQKVTQLLMPDFRLWQEEGRGLENFTVMNDEVKAIIREYGFGGVILFSENVQDTEQTARLTYDLQEARIKDNDQVNDSIPLFIAIDQEGGIVERLGTGTGLPGNMAIGATRSSEYAKNVGEIIGRELSSLGINTNLAPVLDVNNNPHNSVIGLRSFSDRPELVGQLGAAVIEGLNKYNISSAAKHFPGHGDTEVDSHYGLPEVDKSIEELRSLELLPFQKVINEGVDMIMTAHMVFPQLDSEYPATLSYNILTELLREEMGYDGIIMTDAMNMNAIAGNFGEIEATKRAIYAGTDIVLMPTIIRSTIDITNKLDPMIKDLVDEAEIETAFMNRLNQSVRRILQLKEERGILDNQQDKISKEEKVDHALREVGSDLNRDLERIISREAVTVVKNEDHTLPFNLKSNDRVLLVGAYQSELVSMEFSMNRLIDEGVIPSDVTVESVLLRNGNGGNWTREEIHDMLEGRDYVVIISEINNENNLNPANSWLAKNPMIFTEEAKKQDVESVIMSVANPYDTVNYPDANSIITVYGAKGMDPTETLNPTKSFGPNIFAGIEIIFGKNFASGKLPIDLPELDDSYQMTDTVKYPYGHGLTLNEPADSLTLNLPQSVSVGESFEATVRIDETDGITDFPYSIHIDLNIGKFKLDDGKSLPFEVVNEQIIIVKEAGDHDDITIPLIALNEGEQAPVLHIRLTDSKDRIYHHDPDQLATEAIHVSAIDPPESPDVDDEPVEKEVESDSPILLGVLLIGVVITLLIYLRFRHKMMD